MEEPTVDIETDRTPLKGSTHTKAKMLPEEKRRLWYVIAGTIIVIAVILGLLVGLLIGLTPDPDEPTFKNTCVASKIEKNFHHKSSLEKAIYLLKNCPLIGIFYILFI